ncbi:uncharacterized protein BDW43DRAFT_306303 [Aspergillus alliaceus]|uniref:uncharacterized protein n=1 Tax=Petromyces alliaceus TaxID=209559 RepID=UPI0012A72633|nr:uncharacterized protein BDW43DRAFT_306303 [Aspergillus alliaceus]KAB8238443.1 hypothetical protein BDW43DRAFT_306303 [Aspergillus alliaceus]
MKLILTTLAATLLAPIAATRVNGYSLSMAFLKKYLLITTSDISLDFGANLKFVDAPKGLERWYALHMKANVDPKTDPVAQGVVKQMLVTAMSHLKDPSDASLILAFKNGT